MQMDQIKEMCLRMEDLCALGGIPPFDRVRYAAGLDELWFLWEETKLAVVIELTDDVETMAASLARATAGDAVLN